VVGAITFSILDFTFNRHSTYLFRANRFYKLLKEQGEGVYGISILIDNYDEEVKRLKERGVPLEETSASLFPDHPFRLAWVPPEEGHGVWLELVEMEALPDFEKAWESRRIRFTITAPPKCCSCSSPI
jgi:hypothetical protein